MRTVTLDTIMPLLAGLALLTASILHSVFNETPHLTHNARVVITATHTATVPAEIRTPEEKFSSR